MERKSLQCKRNYRLPWCLWYSWSLGCAQLWHLKSLLYSQMSTSIVDGMNILISFCLSVHRRGLKGSNLHTDLDQIMQYKLVGPQEPHNTVYTHTCVQVEELSLEKGIVISVSHRPRPGLNHFQSDQ